MKKPYEKPALLCEELRPEELLCGCAAQSPLFDEIMRCTYPYKGKYTTQTYNLFIEHWGTCDPLSHVYCYHMGHVQIFGS